MKHSKYLLSIPVMVIVIASIMATGQSVPQLINYQGRLTDSSGQPLDGVTVDLAFAFYGVESGNTPTYLAVLQENVVVSKGVYNVLIGSGTITSGDESTLADVFQKHKDVWMGVKVDVGSEMTPRARISSVSYAMQADKVSTSWLTAFVGSNDYDKDGYNKPVDGSTALYDCDDGDASIHPGGTEICNDGRDNNCDGYAD